MFNRYFDSTRDFERKLRVHLYHHIESIIEGNVNKAVKQESNDKTGRIFLSHRSVDHERVGKVHNNLIESGLNPWMAEYDILPGQSWKQEIETAIKNSDAASETGFSIDSELSIAENINELLGEDHNSSSTGNQFILFLHY